MKKLSIILFLSLFINLTIVAQGEHLIPVKDFKEYKGSLENYYDSVFALLYLGYEDTPLVRYTATPSFDKEYAFSLENHVGQYFIKSNKLGENFWYSKKRHKVKVNTSITEIEHDLAMAISEMFQHLLNQCRIPTTESYGNDGTTYYFSGNDNIGIFKTCETWSPRDKTLLERVVKVSDQLFEIGQGKYISQTGVLKDIQKIISDLKK